MLKNSIQLKNEVETFTNTKSQVFYSKKSDFYNIDQICKKNKIDILDNITPYYNNRLSIYKLPKYLKLFIFVLIVIIISIFIFQ